MNRERPTDSRTDAAGLAAEHGPEDDPTFDELIHMASRFAGRQLEMEATIGGSPVLEEGPGGHGRRPRLRAPGDLPILLADREDDRIDSDTLGALAEPDRQSRALLDARLRAATFGDVLQRSRNRAAELLDWQRSHDTLTALPLRAAVEKRAEQIGDAAGLRGAVPMMSALAIDISEIGQVNAAHGWPVGDAVIRELAYVLAERLPGDAMLSRTGGAGFIALVPDADLSLAGAVAASIHLRLVEPIHAPGTDPVTLSATIGTANCGGGSPIGPAELLPAAEAAAVEAKGLGPRSTVAAGADTISTRAREGMVRNALAAAIRAEAITVAYMPIVRLVDRATSGHEALARWSDPQLGSVSPAEFIALAERNGMVGEIDDLILRAALADLARGAIPSRSVSVNLSPAGIDAALPGRIAAALEESGVEPGCLTLEVTEHAPIRDAPAALEALSAVRELGVRIAIDDFGAGITSLALLGRLPLTHLKIDRSLTTGLIGPEADRNLVVIEAIAAMAGGLGLEVLAEGIEREEQAATLLDGGVRFGQGFLFGRAASTEAMEAEM